MAKAKVVRTIAENLGLARKVDTGAEAAASAADVARFDPNAPGSSITFLDEFEETAAEIDRAVTPQTIVQQVEQAQLEEIENARIAGVTDPGVERRLDHQTIDASEFTTRLNDQLSDPEFAARSIMNLTETDELGNLRTMLDAGSASGQERQFVETVDAVRSSQKRHQTMVEGIFKPLNKSPRWKIAVEQWIGDSPYANDLQFHVDRHTDPTRANSFIQFEEPREFGIHSGTNEAAETTIDRLGVENVMRNQQQQTQAIEQIANIIGRPVKDIERAFGRAADDHFRQVFTKQAGVDVWQEVDEILDTFADTFNPGLNEPAQFKAGIKSMPRPNTTPFLFRGKNGLLLEDTGGFKTGNVAKQLETIFPGEENLLAIDVALGASGEAAQQKALQKFIESKGFDHVIYHNSVEDKGSLSIINWNPDLMASPWDAQFTRNAGEQAKAATSFVMAAMGFGGASATVRDEQ
jgi:hypothetical protein